MASPPFAETLKLTPYWWDHVPRQSLPEAVLPSRAEIAVIGSS